MAKIAHNVDIESWDHFVSLTDKFDVGTPFRSAYLFRGQAKDEWDLIPSLVRYAKGMDPKETLEVEKEALKEFTEHAYLYLPNRAVPESREALLGWWSLMQHYNVPTRTLDWTESPFVAAYFAVDQHPDSPGAIWVVHVRTVKNHLEKISLNNEMPKGKNEQGVFCNPDATPNLYFIARRIHTDRMGPQQTVSTVSEQILADHGQVIAGAGSGPKQFSKLVVPGTLKPTFLHKLRQMNITARSLFPGIDGLGRSVGELVKLGAAYYTGKVAKKVGAVEKKTGS